MQTKNSGITFSITNTIDHVPLETCRRYFGDDCIEGWGYHKAFETSNIKEFKLRYLIAEENAQLLAVAPFFVMEFSFTTLIQGRFQKPMQKLENLFPAIFKKRLLFVGLPTAEQLYLGINPEADKTTVLEAIIEEICQISKNEKAKIPLFYNLTEKDTLLQSLLRKKGFVKMESFPNTVLAINTPTLEDFIDGLSKNMRKDIRRKLKNSASLAKLHTKVFDTLPDAISEDMFRLYLNNFSDSDVHFETLTREFFENIFRYMPGVSKVFITYHNDRIVAFNLCLIENDTCIDKFVGFDKDVYREYHLYFTTICNNIKWCIENNIRFYQMGITDYHPKIRLGAKLIPLSIYFKHLNPVLNAFSAIVAKLIQPRNFDPTLKKIKATKPISLL